MTSLTDRSDGDLLKLIVRGDEEAFTALYRRRQGGIYRFALHMSGSAAIAEEVTQEVFMALVSRAGEYDAARGTVAAYLYGMARNHVLRCLERERPFLPLDEESRAEEAEAGPVDPLLDLTRREGIEALHRAVLALPARYREVLALCDLHEMSYDETAGALGLAVGTVRSRLHRARALLLDKLRPMSARRAVPEGTRTCRI